MKNLATTFYFTTLLLIISISTSAQAIFESQTIDDKVAIGYGLGIGDVDGDGKKDILLADKKQFVWYRNGDWKRFVMIEDLTARDNVCIAARDLDGDGMVEVAVGAQWNPGETSDFAKSGSVHYLIRPKDPTQKWTALKLAHEPTIHRMRWIKVDNHKFQLVVVPLHGRGNKGGEGRGVKIMAYNFPKKPHKAKKWKYAIIDSSLHMTHNFEPIEVENSPTKLLLGGKEGIKELVYESGTWKATQKWIGQGSGFGELRQGKTPNSTFITGIQPMHGNELTVYMSGQEKQVLTSDLNQGHALACGDFLELESDQIVVGWRNPNEEAKVGIRLYVPQNKAFNSWKMYTIDDDQMACEDIKLADLDGDGKLDIVAAGRASKNLVVYWNQN